MSNFGNLMVTLIAVYWIPARATGDDSEIFYRQKTFDNSNDPEIDKFVREINEARDIEEPTESTRDIKTTDIKSAICITWSNLKPFPDFLANVSI